MPTSPPLSEVDQRTYIRWEGQSWGLLKSDDPGSPPLHASVGYGISTSFKSQHSTDREVDTPFTPRAVLLNENSDFSTNRGFTSHGIENVTGRTVVSDVADMLGHRRGAETLRWLGPPGWLGGPELKNVLCVSGSELHRPSAHGLLDIRRATVQPLALIRLERLVDRGLNTE